MSNELEYRHEVKVHKVEERQKIPPDTKKELKESGMIDDRGQLKLKGVSPKMLKRMKQEYVECPVLEEKTHFIKCFVCPNFQSRVTGNVLCKGDPI